MSPSDRVLPGAEEQRSLVASVGFHLARWLPLAGAALVLVASRSTAPIAAAQAPAAQNAPRAERIERRNAKRRESRHEDW